MDLFFQIWFSARKGLQKHPMTYVAWLCVAQEHSGLHENAQHSRSAFKNCCADFFCRISPVGILWESHVTLHIFKSLPDTVSFSIYVYFQIHTSVFTRTIWCPRATHTCAYTYRCANTHTAQVNSARDKFHWIQWKLQQITKPRNSNYGLWPSDSFRVSRT